MTKHFGPPEPTVLWSPEGSGMIVNLRGTSGSGKSTLVRNLMGLYKAKMTFRIKDRARPIAYQMIHPDGGRNLTIIGHYETDCGGCDTITEIDEIFRLVRLAHSGGTHVLFEGLLLSAEFKRTNALAQDGYPLTVVALDTPIEECLRSVNKRRRDSYERRLERINVENAVKAEYGHKLLPLPEYRGDVNPRNTETKHQATAATARRLQENLVQFEWHSRESAFLRLREVFEI